MDNNDELARKLALKNLLESPGCKLFREEMKEQLEFLKCQADKVYGGFDLAFMGTANFNLGALSGLKRAVSILEGFEEELLGDNSSEADVNA